MKCWQLSPFSTSRTLPNPVIVMVTLVLLCQFNALWGLWCLQLNVYHCATRRISPHGKLLDVLNVFHPMYWLPLDLPTQKTSLKPRCCFLLLLQSRRCQRHDQAWQWGIYKASPAVTRQEINGTSPVAPQLCLDEDGTWNVIKPMLFLLAGFLTCLK